MKRLVLFLVLAVVAAGGYWGYRNQPFFGTPAAKAQQAAPQRQGGGVPIEVAKPERATVTEDLEALGTLAADESVVIAPEIAGRVVELGFKEGEAVKRGQALVKLDTAILSAELKQAQSDVGLARDTYERLRSLVQRGSGTQVAMEQAAAALASQEARLQLSQAKMAQSTIAAPFDGVIGLRSVGVGDFVSVGKQLITLTKIDTMKVDFRVPEIFLSKLKVGQNIQLRVDAYPDRQFAGEIFAIDPVVDTNGRAIRLRAFVPNKDLTLKPGLFARVTIIVDQRPNALLVPETAIVPQPVGQAVFIVQDGKAKRISVEIGKRLPGKVEVTSGVTAEMQVVTAGQMRLREGATVAVKERQTQTSAVERNVSMQ